MIKIDKKVPIPSKQGGKTYPWDAMKVDDSFFVPRARVKYMPSATYAASKRYPKKKFRCFSVVEKKVQGWRVWRVK